MVDGRLYLDGYSRATLAGIVNVLSSTASSAGLDHPCIKSGLEPSLNLSGIIGTSGSSALRIVDNGDWRDMEERVLPVELMALVEWLIVLYFEEALMSEKIDRAGAVLAGGT